MEQPLLEALHRPQPILFGEVADFDDGHYLLTAKAQRRKGALTSSFT